MIYFKKEKKVSFFVILWLKNVIFNFALIINLTSKKLDFFCHDSISNISKLYRNSLIVSYSL